MICKFKIVLQMQASLQTFELVLQSVSPYCLPLQTQQTHVSLLLKVAWLLTTSKAHRFVHRGCVLRALGHNDGLLLAGCSWGVEVLRSIHCV